LRGDNRYYIQNITVVVYATPKDLKVQTFFDFRLFYSWDR